MKRAFKITLKILAGTIGSIVILLIIALLLLRLPKVQNYVTHKVVAFVSKKTHSRIELKRLYVAFPKSIVIEDLFAEDLTHDTILNVSKLKVNIDLLALLKSKVSISNVSLQGANANIKRSETDSAFNFDFIIRAFTNPSTKKESTDSTKSAWAIDVGSVNLENIRATFDDQLNGTLITGKIGTLDLDMKAMDVSKLSFEGKNLKLAETDIKLYQNKEGKDSPDTAITVMPFLALNLIELHHVNFLYESKPNGQSYNIQAGNAQLKPDSIDLNGHSIKAKSIIIDSTDVAIALMRDTTNNSETTQSSTNTLAGLPWVASAGKVNLNKVSFKLDFTNAPHIAEGVDYNHMWIQDINLDVQDASYTPDFTKANIKNLTLKEQSGFVLKKLSAEAVYASTYAEVSDLEVITNRTTISRHVKITYTAIQDIGKDVGELGIEADLRNTRVSISDILFFAPQIKDIPVFKGNKNEIITVSGTVHGKLNDLIAQNLNVRALDSTSIILDGKVKGLPDALNSKYEVQIQSISTTRNDLQKILRDKLPSSINIPSYLALSGNVNGSIKDAKADLQLISSSGNADVAATFKMANGDTAYTAKINTEGLDIGYLLKQEKLLGKVTLTADADGHNFSLSNMETKLTAKINSVDLNKYNYHNLSVEAEVKHNIYHADVVVKDSNLAFDLKGDASLVKDHEFVNGKLNIEGANLQALHLVNDNIKASAQIAVDMTGDLEDLNGKASVNNIMVIKDKDIYRVDSLVVASINDGKRSALKMNSGVVMVDYDGTVKLTKLISSLTAHINRYFTITNALDTAIHRINTADQNFKLAVKVLPHPIINGLLPGIKKFNGLELEAGFNTEKNDLNVSLNVPVLQYGSTSVEDLNFKVNTNDQSLGYKLTAETMKAGPVKLAETTFQGVVADDNAVFALNVYDKDSADKLIVSGNLKQDKPKEYTLHLDENKLTINNEKWLLPEDNYIRFGKEGIFVNKIDLKSNTQLLSAQSNEDGNELKVDFKHFELGTLSQIIEDDTALVRGELDGTIDLRNLKKSMAFVSDLTIKNIYYQQHEVGNIQLWADNLSANKYTAKLVLNGYGNDVKVEGYYNNAAEGNQLNFMAAINKLNLQTVEPFTGEQIRRSKGYLAGEVNVTGSASKPILNGAVNFKNASFNVAYINNYLTLKDERVSIDSKGIYFNSFSILDSMGQKASLNGAVYTSDFKKMKFDATLTTNNFMALNTSIRDNPLFFGKVIISSNISIKGDETLPIVRANVTLLEGSDVAVVVPSAKVSIDRGEGVVVLADTAETYDIMNSVDTTVMLTAFKGVDIGANIEITKKTTFKVIVDKQSGDSLVVKGEGRLSFSMDETGNQNLTGTYYLNDGGYKATFEKIIKRELKIQPGGSITWNGSPLDADVDITAVYSVKTSPVDLLANDLGASSSSELNAYRKPMRFDVLMSMKGSLLKPHISFALDMAEADKNAYGGIVYSKIQSLNNDPSELNKQVFALIIMKKFIPSGVGGSDGAGDVATTFARNSVSQILTDQLNRLSGNLIKGVDLNFGIRSNDDYTATGVQQNTEFSVGVSKSFFRDRLTVKLGTSINVDNNTGSVSGTDANNLTGDIVLEYKINKEGTLVFKAFRENQYEGIIDGSLYRTGVGFSVTKDYDTPKELFTPTKTKAQRKEENRLDKEQALKEKEQRKAARKARKAGLPPPTPIENE